MRNQACVNGQFDIESWSNHRLIIQYLIQLHFQVNYKKSGSSDKEIEYSLAPDTKTIIDAVFKNISSGSVSIGDFIFDQILIEEENHGVSVLSASYR